VSANTLEVWFLTGSQGLYGDDVLRQVAQQPAGVVRDLTSSGDLPLRVVQKPVLTSAEAIRTMCLDATAASQCVGVIAWMHTFSPAKAWIGGLNALDKPLLHLHTQANLSLPWHEIDMTS
jgi:L-arabinose isomerase